MKRARKRPRMYPASIEKIADTAYLTAFYRAQESMREGARFHDPYASLLAGDIGKEIVQALPEQVRESQGIVVRTCVYDEIILRLVKLGKVDTILNLGCGLDTRPYRLSLPSSLHWIDVDFPDLLAYKAKKLVNASPQCHLEQIPLDLTNREARDTLFASINQQAKQVLVLTEGFVIYWLNEQIAALATDLYKQPVMSWWLTELSSPQSLARYGHFWNPLVPPEAQTKFAPEDGVRFFQRYGWKVHEFRIPLEEALRLKLEVPLAWLASVLIFTTKLRKDASLQGSGLLLLEREKDQFST